MTALNLKPDYAEAYIGIARLKREQHALEEAETAILKAVELDPDKAEIYSTMGSIFMAQGYADKAEDAFKKALDLDEDLISAKLGMGHILMERGQLAEAEEIFRAVVDSGEEKIGALFALVQSKKTKPDDREIEILEREAKRLDEIPESKRVHVHFALGKIYDDLKKTDKAFPHFIEGCRLKRKKLEYDVATKDKNFARVREFFSREFIDSRRDDGFESDVPVFVLGMPRSGTTLTEQIIASHPDVFGAGELFEMLEVSGQNSKGGELSFPDNLGDLTPQRLKSMGREYVDLIKAKNSEAGKITDKMPANFVNVGLIHLILPNAKIVHVNRHPLDTCISCFTRLFAYNQNQTYDLYELGRFYRGYKEIMDHWRAVLPEGSFYDLCYEDLVADTEEQAKALIDYCGLDWNDACLKFHKTERNIRTASVTQVRQPIYKTSVARWKRYEQFLTPLIEGLGHALDGEM